MAGSLKISHDLEWLRESRIMKRLALLLFVAGCISPLAVAQDYNEHVQVGVFADYLRFSQTDNNFGDVGARASFQACKRLKFEGQMAYDFNQDFNEGFTDTGTSTITIQRSGLRVLHGEFGPKINIGHHAIQPFVTLKGGFINFQLSNAPATVGTFISSVDGLRRKRCKRRPVSGRRLPWASWTSGPAAGYRRRDVFQSRHTSQSEHRIRADVPALTDGLSQTQRGNGASISHGGCFLRARKLSTPRSTDYGINLSISREFYG
jgi:hypothetical protein